MSAFVPRTRALPVLTGTLGTGSHAMRIARQVARARARLANRALYKFDSELAQLDKDPIDASGALLGRRVPGAVVHLAREFLRQLPATAPAPAMVTNTDGALSFQWTGFNARTFSISVSADGMLVYSGRLGSRRRISGAEPMTDDLPPIIREAIFAIVHDVDAAPTGAPIDARRTEAAMTARVVAFAEPANSVMQPLARRRG